MTSRFARSLLGALLLLTGLAALGGGYYGMTGAKGVPPEWLNGTPFTGYFIPSAILFLVVGGSLLLGGTALWLGWRSSRRLAGGASIVLLGWITVQLTMIGYVSWLQPAMLATGLLGFVSTLLIPRDHHG